MLLFPNINKSNPCDKYIFDKENCSIIFNSILFYRESINIKQLKRSNIKMKKVIILGVVMAFMGI